MSTIGNCVTFIISFVVVAINGAPSGPMPEHSSSPAIQHPAKIQMHPNNNNNIHPTPNQQIMNGNHEGPMPAAATNYDSYSASSYSGGGGGAGNSYGASGSGSSYGGGAEYSNDNYGFDCYGKKPALYGDANYDCRIYHVCQADGRSDTIKCPKWTRFNNYLGICDWHFKVDNYCNPLPEYNKNDYGSGGYQQGGSGGY